MRGFWSAYYKWFCSLTSMYLQGRDVSTGEGDPLIENFVCFFAEFLKNSRILSIFVTSGHPSCKHIVIKFFFYTNKRKKKRKYAFIGRTRNTYSTFYLLCDPDWTCHFFYYRRRTFEIQTKVCIANSYDVSIYSCHEWDLCF